MKHLGIQLTSFISIFAISLVSLLIGVAIGYQTHNNNIEKPTLGMPVPGFEDVDEMIVVQDASDWQTYRNENYIPPVSGSIYDTESLQENCIGFKESEPCDESLITFDNEGNKIIVVENITEFFRRYFVSQNQDTERYIDNRAIGKFYFPEFKSNKLIFKLYTPHSSGCCTLYSLNVANMAIDKSDYHYSVVSGMVNTKNNRFIAVIGKIENELYIVDVYNNTKELLIKLDESETLTMNYSDYSGEAIGNIKWIENKDDSLKIEYSVYDATFDIGEKWPRKDRPLIEVRDIVVPQASN